VIAERESDQAYWHKRPATRRQDAANHHQRAEAHQGKADTMSALSVKQASHRSELSLPFRLTLTAAIRAAVHCTCAALSPSGLRLLS
jgi:hypothetical protein